MRTRAPPRRDVRLDVPPMFLDDLAHDGNPTRCPSPSCDVRSNTCPISSRWKPAHCPPLDPGNLLAVAMREPRRHGDLPVGLALERLDRVDEQVMQQLPQPPWSRRRTSARGERHVQVHAATDDLRAVESVTSVTRLFRLRLVISKRGARGILAERVHHLLHRFDLLDDVSVPRSRICASFSPMDGSNLWRMRSRTAGSGQRILDLVRQAARTSPHARLALRLQHDGDVVEHQHEPARRISSPGSGVHAHMIRAGPCRPGT